MKERQGKQILWSKRVAIQVWIIYILAGDNYSTRQDFSNENKVLYRQTGMFVLRNN